MFIIKYIFRFFKFIITEISALIIKLIVLGIILIFGFSYLSREKKPTIKSNTFLEVDLSKKYNENLIDSPLDFNTTSTNFYQLLEKIKFAKNDKKISGIVLFFDGNTLNKPQISELGEVLKDFKTARKPIYSYGAYIDNNSLLISSYSSATFMPPSAATSANITGYNKEIPYYKSLADKVGIDVDVIHVGNFKSYGENYKRNTISPEYKANTKRILDKTYSMFVDDISKNRNISKYEFSKLTLSGDLMGETSRTLLKNKLIDHLKYYENFKKSQKMKNTLLIERYSIPKIEKNNQIAIVYADGEINYTGDNKKVGGIITPRRLITTLEKANDNPKVKGIVLRINSPGGSALASDIIYNTVRSIKKPIYISIGSVAASGGYYIASGGNKIFADKNSITGSIGVVSLIPNFKKLTEKVGINMEEISRGKDADLYSVMSPMTPEREAKIYQSNLRVYNEFLTKVSYGRNMTKEQVHEIAQGKVWLGEEALKIGLVDHIGGLEDTISSLATNLKIDKNYSVVEIPYEENLENIFESFSSPFVKLNTLLNFKEQSNLKDIVKNDELLFKPILYMSF